MITEVTFSSGRGDPLSPVDACNASIVVLAFAT